MLERIVRCYNAIKAVMSKSKFSNHANQNITVAQLEIIKQLVEVLRPIYNVTVKLSAERVCTLSMILPAIYHIRAHVNICLFQL